MQTLKQITGVTDPIAQSAILTGFTAIVLIFVLGVYGVVRLARRR